MHCVQQIVDIRAARREPQRHASVEEEHGSLQIETIQLVSVSDRNDAGAAATSSAVEAKGSAFYLMPLFYSFLILFLYATLMCCVIFRTSVARASICPQCQRNHHSLWATCRQHFAHFAHVRWLRKLLDNPQLREDVHHDGDDLCDVNKQCSLLRCRLATHKCWRRPTAHPITFLARSADAEVHHDDLAHCELNHLKLVWVLRFPRLRAYHAGDQGLPSTCSC